MPEQRPPMGAGGEARGRRPGGARARHISTGCSSRSTSFGSPLPPPRMLRRSHASWTCASRRTSARTAALLRAALGNTACGAASCEIAPGATGSTRSRSRSLSPRAGLSRDPVPVESLALDPPAEPQPGEVLHPGVLDLLAREPDGGMLVVDYKSDRVVPGEDLRDVNSFGRERFGIPRCGIVLSVTHCLRTNFARRRWLVFLWLLPPRQDGLARRQSPVNSLDIFSWCSIRMARHRRFLVAEEGTISAPTLAGDFFRRGRHRRCIEGSGRLGLMDSSSDPDLEHGAGTARACLT